MLKACMAKLQCADVLLTPAYPSAACPDSSHGSLHSCGTNIHQLCGCVTDCPFH